MNRIELLVGNDPALFDGHFPGHPILPGAKLLDLVIVALQARGVLARGGIEVASAKFLATVAPSSQLDLGWTEAGQGACRFECRLDGRTVAIGLLRAAAGATDLASAATGDTLRT